MIFSGAGVGCSTLTVGTLRMEGVAAIDNLGVTTTSNQVIIDSHHILMEYSFPTVKGKVVCKDMLMGICFVSLLWLLLGYAAFGGQEFACKSLFLSPVGLLQR